MNSTGFLGFVNSLIAWIWAPVWLPTSSTQFEYLNIHVATFQLLKNLRHLHSVDLDFVYVCSISYTVIGRSQNFYAAVLWAEMSRSAAHFHALRDIPINYCTGVNGHDTPENQRSTLSPFVAPPPLLLFTSLTDLEQQTAAKWPTFWHFRHFLSFAKHCSGFVWGRPHLPHFFWLCFWDESFFFPLPFRQRELTGVFLLWISSTFFDAREFWSVTWDLTISYWRAIWMAVSSVKSDFNCNFWDTFLVQDSDDNPIPYLLIPTGPKITVFS